VKQLESRLEAVEQELAGLHHELSETQERLDFAERLLAQGRETKRLGEP
jgi:predicted  nucleic acid-binding Zn-ribbon protein